MAYSINYFSNYFPVRHFELFSGTGYFLFKWMLSTTIGLTLSEFKMQHWKPEAKLNDFKLEILN